MIFDISTTTFESHRKNSENSSEELIGGDEVASTIDALGIKFRQRVFDPAVTLFGFLSQVFNSDKSSLAAVAGIIAARLAKSLPACCLNTGSYSKAKARLPLELLTMLTQKMAIADQLIEKWGRVFVVDGTGFSMPDTKANRVDFPLRRSAKSGFPLGRMAAIFSLASGSLVDLAVGPYQGKGTGELTLMQKFWSGLVKGDVLLGDALFSNFATLVRAAAKGVDVVAEMRSKSTWRLNKKQIDQIIEIEKPRKKPLYITAEEFASWPEKIKVRVVKLMCAPKGFRAKIKYIMTTRLDAREITPQDIMNLYKQRWQVEINLRSIKTTLGMDVLRGLTPDMVIKEIWVHMLAYNLIRKKIFDAAKVKKVPATALSFQATRQLMHIARVGASLASSAAEAINALIDELIMTQIVGKRPDRYEPRALKRRKKNFKLLSEPRQKARIKLHKKA